MNDNIPEKTQRDFTGAVIRAARELRNATRNMVLEDLDATEAWGKLDDALNARDDFMRRLAEGS